MQHLIRDYDALTRAIASERKRRGFSQLAFDQRVGLADGHTAKLEAGARRFGLMSLPNVLSALGCVLILAPVSSVTATRRDDPPEQLALPIDLPTRAELAKRAVSKRRSVAA